MMHAFLVGVKHDMQPLLRLPIAGDGDDLTDIKSTKLTDRVHELNSISRHGK